MTIPEVLTHSENTLTLHVLTKEQRAAGYSLREDDRNIFVCKEGWIKAICSLHTTSDAIRNVVNNLIVAGGEIGGTEKGVHITKWAG